MDTTMYKLERLSSAVRGEPQYSTLNTIMQHSINYPSGQRATVYIAHATGFRQHLEGDRLFDEKSTININISASDIAGNNVTGSDEDGYSLRGTIDLLGPRLYDLPENNIVGVFSSNAVNCVAELKFSESGAHQYVEIDLPSYTTPEGGSLRFNFHATFIAPSETLQA